MPFGAEERKRIWDALRQKGVPEKCPICEQGELLVSNCIAFVPAERIGVVGRDCWET